MHCTRRSVLTSEAIKSKLFSRVMDIPVFEQDQALNDITLVVRAHCSCVALVSNCWESVAA